MEPQAFADVFARAFQDVYLHAVRRVRDKRGRLTPETTAFLLHLAEAGPMTLGELTRHLDRAASTLSEMVDHLEAKGFVRRDADSADGRRTFIWLTTEGREVLAEEMQVLDGGQLARAAARLDPDQRAQLAEAVGALVQALKAEAP
ncbi:MAG: MarR family transcriptional regulator [Pseudomonadota bacterium]